MTPGSGSLAKQRAHSCGSMRREACCGLFNASSTCLPALRGSSVCSKLEQVAVLNDLKLLNESTSTNALRAMQAAHVHSSGCPCITPTACRRVTPRNRCLTRAATNSGSGDSSQQDNAAARPRTSPVPRGMKVSCNSKPAHMCVVQVCWVCMTLNVACSWSVWSSWMRKPGQEWQL